LGGSSHFVSPDESGVDVEEDDGVFIFEFVFVVSVVSLDVTSGFDEERGFSQEGRKGREGGGEKGNCRVGFCGIRTAGSDRLFVFGDKKLFGGGSGSIGCG
jgi:hypothetical protein